MHRPSKEYSTSLRINACAKATHVKAFTFYTLLFISTASLLFLSMDRNINLYDEGLVLTGAMRVAAGDIPHRDFYANYGPAQFYVLGSLFKVFGSWVLVERAFDIVVRALIVTLTYALTAVYCRKWIAATAALLCALWFFCVPFYGYPMFPVILLTLISAALVIPTLAAHSCTWRLVASGAAMGMAALFRYDVAFVVFLLIACAITVSARFVPRTPRLRGHAVLRMLAPYVIGTSIIFLPVACLYLAVAPISPFIHDILSFPLHNYVRTRSLPFPGLFEMASAVYLPIPIFCAALYSIGQSLWRRDNSEGWPPGNESERNWALLLLALIAAALYGKGLVRISVVHMLSSFVPSFIVLAIVVERALQQRTLMLGIAGVLAGITLAVTAHASVKTAAIRLQTLAALFSEVLIPTARAANTTSTTATWCGTPRELRKIACFWIDANHEEAVRFLVQVTNPGERIFVGLNRHDKIVVNDNLTYFAADRMPATHWHHFDPGLQTSADVQTEMVAELQSSSVRYLVLTSQWDGVSEPNDSAKSTGVHILDEYIRAHYNTVRTFGPVTVWLRSDACLEDNEPRMLSCAADFIERRP